MNEGPWILIEVLPQFFDQVASSLVRVDSERVVALEINSFLNVSPIFKGLQLYHKTSSISSSSSTVLIVTGDYGLTYRTGVIVNGLAEKIPHLEYCIRMLAELA